MRRGTGEWQQYVFKIVDNHLQCLSLKEVSKNFSGAYRIPNPALFQKLHKEIHLTDVKDVKAHRSNNQMFTFHVRFDGKDSPWILSANSQVRQVIILHQVILVLK